MNSNQLMTDRDSWEQLRFDAIKSGHNQIFFLNEMVKDLSRENPVGFYIVSKENEYGIKSYKLGLTKVGILERAKTNKNSFTTDDIIVFGWFPSNLAKTDKYDQKILADLQDQGKCILRKTLDKDLSAQEWAIFPDDNPSNIVRDYLSKVENGLIRKNMELTIWQIEIIDKIYSMLNSGKCNKKLIAELAARFGKTLTFLALFYFLQKRVLVVSTYYLTALNSFKDEIIKYNEFIDYEVIDLSDPNFKESYNTFIEQNKKIVITGSLCGNKEVDTSIRNQNAEFVSQIADKITVIDEADYGAHTKNCVALIDKLGKGSDIIFTTGTNSGLVSNYHKIDGFVKQTYFDMQTKALSNKLKVKNSFLKDCKRALKFEKNLVKLEFYANDWSPFLEFLLGKDVNFNPGLAKCSADVYKSESFWKGLYRSMLGTSDNMYLNDYSLGNLLRGKGESVIQWVNVKNNKELKNLEKIARTILHDEYDVYAVCGEDTLGKNSERFVKDKIIAAKYRNKKVWIICNRMCQRSFSIPDINVAILTYDNGDIAAMIQRISRILTNGNKDKTGYVIDFSIDKNRHSKVIDIIFETAKEISEREGIDIASAVKQTYRTSPVFQLNDGYIQQLEVDDITKKMFAQSNFEELMINKNRLFHEGCLDSIDLGNFSSKSQKIPTSFEKPKTYIPSGTENTFERNSSEINDLYKERYDKIREINSRANYCVNEIKKNNKKLNYKSFINLFETNRFISDCIGTSCEEFEMLFKQNYLNLPLFSIYSEKDS